MEEILQAKETGYLLHSRYRRILIFRGKPGSPHFKEDVKMRLAKW
jgi:hypothetical protein